MSFFLGLRIYGWFSLRYARRHLWRTAAVIVGLSLGAGIFVAVRFATTTSVRSFERSMGAVSGRADFVVTRPGEGVPSHLVRDLLSMRHIETASPILSLMVRVQSTHRGAEGAAVARWVGLDPILDRPLRPWAVQRLEKPEETQRWMRLMSDPDTVFVGSTLARALRLEAGSAITVHYQDRRRTLKVLGILKDEGLGLAHGGLMLISDVATVQEFLGQFERVDRVEGVFVEGGSETGYQELENLLGSSYALDRVVDRTRSSRSMVAAYEQNLSVLSFVSLFVGMFLVYSLTAFNSVSRRREVAVMRSLGASARFVFFVFILDGLVLGLLGWAIGIPVSLAFSRDLLQAVSATVTLLFARVDVSTVSLNFWDVAVSVVLTTGVAALAAWQPAHSMMRVPPQEAIRPRSAGAESETKVRRLTMAGLGLLATVLPLCMMPPLQGVPVAGYAAVFFLFCGFSLLAPGVLKRLSKLPSPLVRRLGGEPCVLALRQLERAGARVALSVGALITAVGLFTALVIMISSFRKTVEAWVYQTVSGDLFVRPMMADMNGYRDPLPAHLVHFLRNIPDVDVVAYRRIAMSYRGVDCALEGIDLDRLQRHGGFLFLKGNPQDAYDAMKAGDGVIVSEVFSNRTGFGVGDRMALSVLGVPMEFRVVGVYRDYRTQSAVIYTDLRVLHNRTKDRAWSGARLFFPGSEEAKVQRALEIRDEILTRFGARDAPDVMVGKSLRRDILQVFDQTFAVTTVLLVMALMVASLGMMTTLTIMVLERSVFLNTLIAVGSSPGQVRRMLLWEALFMAVAGLVLGVACGFVLSTILIEVINAQSFGWTFLYHVAWNQLGVALPLIAAASLVATVPAQRLAFRDSPVVLLREDDH
ncbi:FtsX-like permease family protein [Desulfosoma caldarium]|uniref:Putative ABC transport system permease protein n=1 Tax=Desulfosoma caldarium TaxID=610254 RepID=A0A3N1UW32_9BACT|nr:ABC transporter permease [Desulfosoma caldarium]ROQ92121.1 putative ABC transport system permease protein [Desulfosoma caldarium]